MIGTDTTFDLNQKPFKPTYQTGCDYDLQGSPNTAAPCIHSEIVYRPIKAIPKLIRMDTTFDLSKPNNIVYLHSKPKWVVSMITKAVQLLGSPPLYTKTGAYTVSITKMVWIAI